MSTSKEYLSFILDQLSLLEDVTYLAMMREYVIYYKGKVVGGIYDNRFMIKPVAAAKEVMPDAEYQAPYDGAKELILVDNLEDKEFLAKLLNAMYDELPAPKKKASKRNKLS